MEGDPSSCWSRRLVENSPLLPKKITALTRRCGYWPGPPGEDGVFYGYAYPEPPSFRDTPVTPGGARRDHEFGEFVLPYEIVRTAPDPDALLLEFLQSTYEGAAVTAAWDRAALERPNGPSAWLTPAPISTPPETPYPPATAARTACASAADGCPAAVHAPRPRWVL